ncbi:hypothetical protein APR50_10795 [Variovorax paradoxus]|nr:hypothetical protein APR49_38430 [Variovorax paradoxus]KPU99402.1 hypothetical protein APR52_02955 [Variovorax paradoxus]KPV08680.1 hypothetical protein APR50_10795 [Variovorax paradoxus]KPV15309.1 hypothetical protein APR51_35140 [Variovorax paradoxus]KPV33613.1 hypothetical protein APR48_09865 [Variovorax paradoxus]
MPFLALLFLLSFLDRANVSFAALGMNKDLGFTPTVYALGVGVFFLGYVLFEVPSNMMIEKIGARRWIAPLTIAWGCVAMAMAFVHDANSFFVLRFLLGVAEAGLLPGLFLYLTYWFPAEYRGRMSALIMAALPVSLIVSGPVSGAILSLPQLQGLAGLKNWQWMFIIEGLPTLIAGLAVYRLMPDRPRDAAWLRPEEAQALESALDRENRQATPQHRSSLRDGLWSAPVLVLSLAYFGGLVGSFGIIFWVPQIVRGFGASTLQTGFISAIPFVVALVVIVALGRYVDRTGRRFSVCCVALTAGALGLWAAGSTAEPVLAIAALSVAAAGIMGSTGGFWTLPQVYLKGSAIAAAFAMINSVGALGGFVGPYIIGWAKERSGGFGLGLTLLSLGPLAAALLVAALGRLGRPQPAETGDAD